MRRLKQLANTPAEQHALQDGFVLGVLFAMSFVYPPLLALAAGALGLSGASNIDRKRLIKKADNFVRVDDITDAPEYFIMGLASGIGPTFALGVVFGFVSFPTIA